MVNVITAVVTQDALKFWPSMFGSLATFKPIITFKVGEGGWIDEGAGRVPRTPDPTLRRLSGPVDSFGNFLQDLDAVVDPTRPAELQRYLPADIGVFEKTLDASDLVFQPPSSLRVRCFLDLVDFTIPPPPGGLPAEMYEIGLFTDHPDLPGAEKLMVAYGTFPEELKDGARQMENIVLVTFGGS